MKIYRLLSSLQSGLTKRSSSYTIWFRMRCWMTSCLNHDYLILTLRFSQFSGCWLILSVCWLMIFAFPFGRLLSVRWFCYYPYLHNFYRMTSCLNHDYLILIFIHFPYLLYEKPSLIIVSAETEYFSTRSWYRNINFLRDWIRRIRAGN
jgi:hypothetical protein